MLRHVGKVALIAEIEDTIVAAQTLCIIRLDSNEHLEENAIALYIFFKSHTRQALLKTITAGNNIPQIPVLRATCKFNHHKLVNL